MISILITAVVVGGVLGLLIQNIKIGATVDYNYAAVNIAKSRIDRIRELRRESGYSFLGTASEADMTVDREGVPDLAGEFTRHTVMTTNYAGNANLTHVKVRVDYKASGDVTGTAVELETIISPYM